MRLRERFKNSTVTDWLLTLFTGALVAVAIYQYTILSGQLNVLSGQLNVMRKDERAWLTMAGSKTAAFEPATLRFPLVITDIGKTPALDVRANFYVEIVQNGSEPQFEGPLPHFNWEIGAISPNETKPITIRRFKEGLPGTAAEAPVSPDEKDALESGKAWLAIYGKVEYRDVFGSLHWIKYCWWGNANGATGYSARSCSNYNNVDRD